MVYTCFLCKWRGDYEPKRSFHKFPANENDKKKWLENIGKNEAVIGTRTTLCSLHFEEKCFKYGSVCGKKILKEGSLPSINLEGIKGKPKTDYVTSNETEEYVVLISEPNSPSKVAVGSSEEPMDDQVPAQQILMMNSTPERNTKCLPVYLRTQLNVANEKLEMSRMKIKSLQRQVRTLQKTKLSLKALNKNYAREVRRLEKEVKSLRPKVESVSQNTCVLTFEMEEETNCQTSD